MLQHIRKYFYTGQIFIFLFFVFAASVGWLLNKLSADYLRTVTYAVELYNSNDQRYIFDTETPIDAQVQMSGFADIKTRLTKDKLIRIDIGNRSILKLKSNKAYILSSDIFNKISEHLGDGQKLISIHPDTLFCTYAELQSKLLPINPNLDLRFAKEYMQKGKTLLTPDSIWVSAEQAVLDSITEVKCVTQKFENLKSTISGILDVEQLNNKKILYQKTKIKFKAIVERYSEGIVKVPVHLLNLPQQTDVLIFPSEIEVKYRANINDFSQIDANKFRPTADFNDLKNSLNGNLKISIEQPVDKTLQIDLHPKFIEIIVTKK